MKKVRIKLLNVEGVYFASPVRRDLFKQCELAEVKPDILPALPTLEHCQTATVDVHPTVIWQVFNVKA